jgi:hypothetical protein
MYRAKGKLAEAAGMYRRELAGYEWELRLAKEHTYSEVQEVAQELAEVYVEMGKQDEADRMQARVRQRLEEVYGPPEVFYKDFMDELREIFAGSNQAGGDWPDDDEEVPDAEEEEPDDEGELPDAA